MSKKKKSFLMLDDKDRSKDLLSCWKRKKDKETAEKYLDAVEPYIQHWLELKNYPSTSVSHAEIRDVCREFHEKLSDIAKFMLRKKETLYALVGITETTEEEEVVRGAARQLRESSALLGESARKVVESVGKVSTGPDVSAEVLLVYYLDVVYQRVFEKKPSIKNKSCFRCFLSALSKLIKVRLGDATIKRGLAYPLWPLKWPPPVIETEQGNKVAGQWRRAEPL